MFDFIVLGLGSVFFWFYSVIWGFFVYPRIRCVASITEWSWETMLCVGFGVTMNALVEFVLILLAILYTRGFIQELRARWGS